MNFLFDHSSLHPMLFDVSYHREGNNEDDRNDDDDGHQKESSKLD